MLAKSCIGTKALHLDTLSCLCQGDPCLGGACVVRECPPGALGITQLYCTKPRSIGNCLCPQTSTPNGPWRLKTGSSPGSANVELSQYHRGASQRILLEKFPQTTLRPSLKQRYFGGSVGWGGGCWWNWEICILNKNSLWCETWWREAKKGFSIDGMPGAW